MNNIYQLIEAINELGEKHDFKVTELYQAKPLVEYDDSSYECPRFQIVVRGPASSEYQMTQIPNCPWFEAEHCQHMHDCCGNYYFQGLWITNNSGPMKHTVQNGEPTVEITLSGSWIHNV